MLPSLRTAPLNFEEYLELKYGEEAARRMKLSKPTIRTKTLKGCPGIVRQGNRKYSISPIYAKKSKVSK